MEIYFKWNDIRTNKLEVINKLKDSYFKYGLVIVEGVLNQSEINNLSQIYNKISENRTSKNLKPFISHLMPHTWDKRIIKFAKLPSIINLVEIILGNKADLLHSQITFKAPGDEGFSLHQDNYYNRADPIDSMTAAWIAIDNSDDENGTLITYPFSHKEGILPVKKNWRYIAKKAPNLIIKKLIKLITKGNDSYFQESGVVEQFANSIVPKKYKPISLNLKAGGIAFMHGNLVHSSGKNLSKNRFRRNLLLNYICKESAFKAGFISKRKKLNIYE